MRDMQKHFASNIANLVSQVAHIACAVAWDRAVVFVFCDAYVVAVYVYFVDVLLLFLCFAIFLSIFIGFIV